MPRFEEVAEQFLHYLRVVKNASDHTVRNYRLDLESFRSFVPADVSEISKKEIRLFLSTLSSKNAAKKTVLRRLSALRSLFSYLVKEKKIVHNPFNEIDSPKLDKRLPISLTFAQIEHFFNQPDTTSYLGYRDRCMMELFYSSGLRISELVGLNRMDVDERNFRVKVMGKGKKERIVPITQNAAEWLRSYLIHPERHLETSEHKEEQDRNAIFLNKWGKRLTVRSIDRKFADYLKQSGLIGKITPHTIRHTIATHWLEKGMDLKTIQVLLGHSNLATTTIYAQVSSRLKREVYEKAHPLAIKNERSAHNEN